MFITGVARLGNYGLLAVPAVLAALPKLSILS